MAMFPCKVRNARGDRSISYGMFQNRFKEWVERLDVGPAVSHQALHTLATNLLRAGASLAQIRRHLGHVSTRMAERYAKVANSDLEDVLQAVWVAGPGSANPGKLLSGGPTPMSREEALALALDLSRRSTPTEGGICTCQPVVNGAACPWNLDCVNCDKFVLSGADLLYWRRKQGQWRAIAESAPDDATADYLHRVFEPTARAIDGLEKALAGLWLLDQALALDFRRPQDYFHHICSTTFRADDLAGAADSPSSVKGTRRSFLTASQKRSSGPTRERWRPLPAQRA
jgi:Phage integrase family